MSTILKSIEGSTIQVDCRYLICLITAEIAAAILATNKNYRRMRKDRARKYAREMAAGRWTLNVSDPIILTAGNLTNGQHRMKAVLISGVPCRFVVCFHGMEKLDHIVDSPDGLKRSSADFLRHHFPCDVALRQWVHVIRFFCYVLGKYSGHSRLTNFDVLHVAKSICGTLRDVLKVAGTTTRILTAAPVISAVTHYIKVGGDPSVALDFYKIFRYGESGSGVTPRSNAADATKTFAILNIDTINKHGKTRDTSSRRATDIDPRVLLYAVTLYGLNKYAQRKTVLVVKLSNVVRWYQASPDECLPIWFDELVLEGRANG